MLLYSHLLLGFIQVEAVFLKWLGTWSSVDTTEYMLNVFMHASCLFMQTSMFSKYSLLTNIMPKFEMLNSTELFAALLVAHTECAIACVLFQILFWTTMTVCNNEEQWFMDTLWQARGTLCISSPQAESHNPPLHLLNWPLYLDELGSSAISPIVRCSLVAIS